jgi:hypothetical protein
VVLRGLALVGVGGESGINVTSVGTLHVEGCVISGFAANGIGVNLAADGSHILVKDTVTRNKRRPGNPYHDDHRFSTCFHRQLPV